MSPFDIVSYFLTLASLGKTLAESFKQFEKSGMYWEAQNTVADLRMKARGHVSPVLIERLDDSTHPEYQHLRIDFAPSFPPERIAQALHYWPSQSLENVNKVLRREMVIHALRGAQPGDDRTATIVLNVFDFARQALTIHGRVGGEWELLAESKRIDWRGFFATAKARGKMQSELQEQAKERRKMARKAAKAVRERARQSKK